MKININTTGLHSFDHSGFVQSVGNLIQIERKNNEILQLVLSIESSNGIVKEATESNRGSTISDLRSGMSSKYLSFIICTDLLLFS
jgi:hypothetical protein